MKIFFAVLLLIFLCACSSSRNVQESFRSETIDFNSIQNSKITICGVNNISLGDFEYYTNYEYSDTAKLNNKILTTICDQFKTLIPSVISVEMGESIPSFLTDQFSSNDYTSEETSSFFNNLGTDYLMLVDSLNVSKVQNSHRFETRSGAIMTTFEEICEVNIEVELWDAIRQERINIFKAAADETINNHEYFEALDAAIDKTVSAAVMFIKNGGVL